MGCSTGSGVGSLRACTVSQLLEHGASNAPKWVLTIALHNLREVESGSGSLGFR